jgi:4-hydroxybenzoate polyprenyltransferase
MRPQQWAKNLFIFAALIFSGNAVNLAALAKTCLAFLIFCALAGAGYIINDIIDRDKDRSHPVKKRRPIASGSLKVSSALISAILIILIVLLLSLLLPLYFGLSVIIYLFLILAYSLFLRSVIIIDIIIISLGFVLRLLAGGFAISVFSTPWALTMTFFLAIFISLVKRRAEKIELGEAVVAHRKNLQYYKKETIDYFIIISANSVILSYTSFAFFSGKNIHLFITIPFVLYGVFRYMYLAFEHNMGEDPSLVFIQDRPLFYNILCWAIVSTAIIYFT